MKNRILIAIIILCSLSNFVDGQIVPPKRAIDKLFEISSIATGTPPTLVISPQLMAPLTGLQKIQMKMEASKAIATIVTSLRSVHKFASIVEETRCATENLRYAISQLEFTKSAYLQRCDFEVRFNVAVYQLSAIPDLINTVLRSTNMEGSDRVKIVMDTMDKFEKANKDVMALVKDLEDQIFLEEEEKKAIADSEWSIKNVF